MTLSFIYDKKLYYTNLYKEYLTKKTINNVITYTLIFLPLPITLFLFYGIIHDNYRIIVNSTNISTVQSYLDINNIKVESNIKEVVLYSRVFECDLLIIYDTNETEKITFERVKFDKNLANYIIEHNYNNKLVVLAKLLICSLGISTFLIYNKKKA